MGAATETLPDSIASDSRRGPAVATRLPVHPSRKSHYAQRLSSVLKFSQHQGQQGQGDKASVSGCMPRRPQLTTVMGRGCCRTQLMTSCVATASKSGLQIDSKAVFCRVEY
jgi:hypothetical protein